MSFNFEEIHQSLRILVQKVGSGIAVDDDFDVSEKECALEIVFKYNPAKHGPDQDSVSSTIFHELKNVIPENGKIWKMFVKKAGNIIGTTFLLDYARSEVEVESKTEI